MRLLFALSGFHRYDRGAETALLSVAAELARTGDDVTVAGSGAARSGTAYRFVPVPAVGRERFERIPAMPFFRNETQWEDATFALRLGRAVDVASFDAAITCAYPYTSWTLRRFGRTPRPAHIFVTQNGDWPAQADNLEFRHFSCDGLVCTNPQYFERNRHRWNSKLIPNGIDLGLFRPGHASRSTFGLPENRTIILMVSAFIDSKRVLDGIRASAAIDDAMLVVAGDGPLRAEADGLADRLMPGRYRRLSLSAAQMPDLYRAADVFLHLSQVESFGNVYLEAAATGLPVVAHDSGLTRWIMDDAPFLCDTDDLSQVTDRLRAAIDAGQQTTGGELQRFTWPAIAADYRRFIADILERRVAG